MNVKKFRLLPVINSLYNMAGVIFILFSYKTGADDFLSLKELVLTGILTAAVLAASYTIFRKFSSGTLALLIIGSIAGSLAINYEFPELMKLPIQLPAENSVRILDAEPDASLSMNWAYWTRPRGGETDISGISPERDISFSRLIKTGNWNEIDSENGAYLTASEAGASIGVPARFRTMLAVLCLKAEGGAITVSLSGEKEPVRITPEMTADQPYRIMLKNGQLPPMAAEIIQIILWGGVLCLLLGCGLFFCRAAAGSQSTHPKIWIYAAAFLIPCAVLILLCICLKITPFGEKTFLYNDMWSQYADFLAYLRSVLYGENNLFYSFSISLGDDMIALTAYYLANPLNWLVCLFPPEKLPLAVTCLVILRFGICGLTAAIYFVKRRNCGASALLFSTCYALMSFNFVNAENTCLREGTLILPIVILGLEQLIDGDSIRCYIWALAAAMLLNYYSGYQICIFTALYFLFYSFSRGHREPFKKVFLRFAGSSLLSAGIAAFLLIPVVIQLRNGPKSFDPSIFSFSINMPWQAMFGKFLASAFDEEQIITGFPNLYIGLFSAILIPLYLMNRLISGRKKLFTALLLFACILILQINPLNLVLHGFSRPLWWPYRYSFVICFFLLLIAQESFAHREGWTSGRICLAFLLFFILSMILSKQSYAWITEESIKMNAVFLTAYFLLMIFILRKNNSPNQIHLLALITVLELTLNAFHILNINNAYERSNTTEDYASYYTENLPLINQIKSMDDAFYRIEKSYSRTSNDPMLLNYNGIIHYSSTMNHHITDFLAKAGFRIHAPYRIYYWDGSDIAADSLLGIKYLVSGKRIAKPYTPVFSERHTVYENPYALPLMFTASESLSQTVLNDDFGGFEIQNRIFSALTGKDVKIYTPANVKETLITGLDAQNNGADVCYFNSTENPGKISWEIEASANGPLYAFFPAESIHPAALKLNGKAIGSYFDSSSYHILRLGTFRPGEIISLEMIPSEGQVCIHDAQFYHEDLAVLEEAAAALRRDETELQKVSSSHLRGTFTASAGKQLFFTIPYSRGWHIKIDGKTVPVSEAFDLFMSVPAPEGNHTLDMQYIPVGLIPASFLSLFSIAASFFSSRKKSHAKI